MCLSERQAMLDAEANAERLQTGAGDEITMEVDASVELETAAPKPRPVIASNRKRQNSK